MKFLDVPQSGSIAGSTHSHNRAGQYKRNRRAPVQPIGSGRRSQVRANLSSVSSGWSALSAANQALWASYADSHPITDALGQSIKLTGHQMYVRINAQLLNCLDSVVSVPPSDSSVWAVTSPTLTLSIATGALTVGWDAGTVGDFALIAYSPQLSAGRGFNNRWWQASVEDANDGTYVGATAYAAEFGTITAGFKVFAKITPVSSYGVTGTPVVVGGIITA